jgi:signal peptidase I
LEEKGTHIVRGRRRNGLSFYRRKKTINVALLKEIFVWMIEIAITVGLAFAFIYFVGVRTSVVGQSMAETLNSGDEVLINRFIYKVTDPRRGDVIVFLPNGNEKSHYYIKRVIGIPGDTVLISDGTVYVNGEPWQADEEMDDILDAGIAAEEIILGDDEYFVLGDNCNNSEDSRYANIGNIKKEYIIGKVWFRVSSWNDFGFL